MKKSNKPKLPFWESTRDGLLVLMMADQKSYIEKEIHTVKKIPNRYNIPQLKKTIRSSEQIHCQVIDSDKDMILVCINGHVIVTLTEDEYDRAVYPITKEEPCNYWWSNGRVQHSGEREMINLYAFIEKAVKENFEIAELTDIRFENPNGFVCSIYNRSRDVVSFVSENYLNILDNPRNNDIYTHGIYEPILIKLRPASTTDMPEVLLMPVRRNEKSEKVVRAYTNY